MRAIETNKLHAYNIKLIDIKSNDNVLFLIKFVWNSVEHANSV